MPYNYSKKYLKVNKIRRYGLYKPIVLFFTQDINIKKIIPQYVDKIFILCEKNLNNIRNINFLTDKNYNNFIHKYVDNYLKFVL